MSERQVVKPETEHEWRLWYEGYLTGNTDGYFETSEGLTEMPDDIYRAVFGEDRRER